MKQFKLFNNLVGWVVFAIAAFTYLSTIEPTASFWDCGEFIATSYKMEIGHPPGAPLFMLIGRVCSLFASDPSHVAMMINGFSALCSALCILFLFWTITHLARKMVVTDMDNMSTGEMIAILGAGVVGALAYTWSDTFWFSAVEGEVYAFSSLFTAVVVWCILKWEDIADQPYANRWLVLIAYLMGLSVGVHLLNLLTIPVLGLVYYYRKTATPTYKGAFISLLVSLVILVSVLWGVIPGFAEVAGWFELFFCNVLGFGYNIGTLVYALVLIGCLIYSIKITFTHNENYSNKKKIIAFLASITLLGIPFFGSGTTGRVVFGLLIIAALAAFLFSRKQLNCGVLNTILICCTVLLMGYSSYAALVIRSVSNPPMDENSPDDVFALKSYLNRDQYGDTPLLYGETYAAEYLREDDGNGRWGVKEDEGEALYAKAIKDNDSEPDHYVMYDHKKKYEYCSEFLMPFPRMYSKQANHVAAYKEWANIKGHTITYSNMGQTQSAVNPTFGENLTFFFKYQVGYMYLRYFMWNFVGRQNDIQGNGEVTHGGWCSGIKFLDKAAIGDYDQAPAELVNNRGHNTYFFLPFILGILGILYQFSKGEKGMQNFWQVFFLFLLTGLAIVVYLNQTPYQPRERDYAYAGSFYAFSIWIGLGVLFLAQQLRKILDLRIAATIATLFGLGVPALMANQNWDDHDRSNRYTCRDFGSDYLLSLAPNAVVFTNGDNDTFPLWYCQEVEGIGTDARVANLSYLQMGWYVSQMKKDAYNSKALPLTLKEKDYSLGKMDVAYLVDAIPTALSVDEAFKLLTDQNMQRSMKQQLGYDASDDNMQIIPTKHLYIEVDSAEAVNNGGADPKEISNELKRMRYNTYQQLLANHVSNAEMVSAMNKASHSKKYHIDIDLKDKSYLGKQELFILNLLAGNHWKRPIYFAVTVGRESYMGLDKYFRLEGLAFRVMPYENNSHCDTDLMFNNMMHKFKYGNCGDEKVYMDENNQRMATTMRHMFARLAMELLNKGEKDKALQVLDRSEQLLPQHAAGYEYASIQMADMYYALGKTAKGDAITKAMIENSRQYLTWIHSLSPMKARTASQDFSEHMGYIQTLGSMAKERNRKDLAGKCETIFNANIGLYQQMQQSPEGSVPTGDEE